MFKWQETKYLSVLCSLLFVGCASIPRTPGFTDVQQTVKERSGKRVAWYQGKKEDVRVDSVMNVFLKDTLMVDEAVQMALLNNHNLQAVYENLGITQAQVVQAGLLNNPVFSINSVLTMSLVTDFLDIFFIPLKKSIAQSVFEAAKLRVTGAVLDLAGQTRIAYYRVQVNKQLLELQQKIVQSTEASYAAMLRLYQAGNVTRLDMGTEQAFYEQARLDLQVAKLNIKQSREQLNRLMGLWGENTEWIAESRLPAIPSEPIDLDNIEKRAIDKSINLAVSRQEVITYGKMLGLTKKTALFPSFEVGVETEVEDGGREWHPEGALPIPIFDQGQAKKATAMAQLRQQQAQYYALAVKVRSLAREAREQLFNMRRIALHYQNVIIPLRSKNTQLSQLQYNAMQIGVFRLLQAKEQEIEAGRNYLEALYNYWVARNGVKLLLQGRISGLENETMALESPSTPNANTEQKH